MKKSGSRTAGSVHFCLLACLSALLLAGCAAAPASRPPAVAVEPARVAAETRRLNEWFEARYEEQLLFSPMDLTYLGRKMLYDELDDFSIEGEERQLAWQKASVEQMESQFDYTLLDAETKRSWDIWKNQYERAAAGTPFRLHRYPFEQMNGMQSELPTFLISFHEVATEADALAWVSRAAQFPRVLDQLLERAHASAKLGIRPPRFAYEGVIGQALKVITGAPFDGGADSALWADLKAELDAPVE